MYINRPTEAIVALRKESVDRNTMIITICIAPKKSLSARRAWIEINVRCFCPAGCWVALRKESVDRNLMLVVSLVTLMASLSARRAWIEIQVVHQ